jgi:hypothetical protein
MLNTSCISTAWTINIKKRIAWARRKNTTQSNKIISKYIDQNHSNKWENTNYKFNQE